MADVVGMGALNEDIIYTVKPGKEKELIKRMKKETRVHVERHDDYHDLLIKVLRVAGGSAANTITDLAVRGWKCSFIGEIGKDETGKFVEKSMNSFGIKILLTKVDGITGSCGIIVHNDGKYSVLFKEGVSDDIKPANLMIKSVTSCKLFHSSPFASFKSLRSLKTQLLLAKAAKKAGVTVSVSPGRLYTESFSKEKNSEKTRLVSELLKTAGIIFINKNEKSLLSEEKNYRKASSEIFRKFKPEILCITLGKDGCHVRTANEEFVEKSVLKKTVSTLGAGDAFAAGFLDAYLKGKAVKECAKEGNRFAGICVQNINPKNYLNRIKSEAI